MLTMPRELWAFAAWMSIPPAVCIAWLILRNLYGPRDEG